MINTLSQLQINKFPEYVKLWTEKGLTIKPKSLENAIIDFSLFQKNILKKSVAPVVILDSPLKCWIAVSIVKLLFNKSQEQIKSQVRPQVWSQVYSQVSSQVNSQVESQVYSRVWSQVGSQVALQVGSQVREQVYSQVDSQVWSQVREQVNSQVSSQVSSQVRSQVREQVNSQVASQVNSQVWSQVALQVGSQVWSQVSSQVWSQVNSQVVSQIHYEFGSQVRSQVASQVNPQVWSQVYSQVQSQVGSQVNSQVGEQIRSQVGSQVNSQVWLQVGSHVRSQIYSQVRLHVNSQVRSQVNSQVRSQVESQVDSQVRSQVYSQVRSQVESQVDSQVGEQVKLNGQELTFVYPYFDCQFWAGWFSFYEFFRNECGINYPPEYDTFKNCQDYGMVFPLDELCIVCQPPTIIKKNNSGLHCENGPALSYNGDNEIYALNGVVMKKEYVMTPSHEISGEMILKETNTEVRRELLRKVGVERAMNSLPHKLLEKRGNYELYSIDLSNEVKDARYLKMLNPSIKTWHIEGIEPGISTITEALKWRNNNWYEDAEILT